MQLQAIRACALERGIIGKHYIAAHLANKPARSPNHRSELVAESAAGAANNELRLAEGSSCNVVFFEGHVCYHKNTETRGVIIADHEVTTIATKK